MKKNLRTKLSTIIKNLNQNKMKKYIGYYNTNLIIKTRNVKPLNNKNNERDSRNYLRYYYSTSIYVLDV